jgi:hypothetical protein
MPIVADLRALAPAANNSPMNAHTRTWALRLADRVGDLFDIFAMEHVEDQTRYRDLDEKELRVVASLGSIRDLLESFRFGPVPADCGNKLREMADSLEEIVPAVIGPYEGKSAGKPNKASETAYMNEVPWVDEPPPGWISNAEAMTRAKHWGREHEIPELTRLTPTSLNRLLRKPGCSVRFMSTKIGRPRGRIYERDWGRYLGRLQEQEHLVETQVERGVRELI